MPRSAAKQGQSKRRMRIKYLDKDGDVRVFKVRKWVHGRYVMVPLLMAAAPKAPTHFVSYRKQRMSRGDARRMIEKALWAEVKTKQELDRRLKDDSLNQMLYGGASPSTQ